MAEPIQAGISVQALTADPEFLALPDNDKRIIMEEADPEFRALPDTDKAGIIGELKYTQTPTVTQGLGNVGNTIGSSVGQAVQAIPQMIQQAPGQIMNAVGTQAKTFTQSKNPLLDMQIAATTKGLDSLSNLATGIYNLRGDLTNAYTGRQTVQPTQAPQTTQLPIVGGYIKAMQEQNPVAGFVGENMPYAFPVAQAARAKYLASIAEGAGLGALSDPGQVDNRLQARTQAGVMGGALPTALGAAGRAIAKPKPVVPQRPQVQMRNVNQALEQAGQLQQAKQLRAAITKRQDEILNAQAITEQKTLSDRLTKLNQMYKGLDELERGPDKLMASRAAQMKAQVKTQYDKVYAEQQAKFPSKKTKQTKIIQQGQLPMIINLGLKAVKAGGESKKRFKQVVKGYTPQDQSRINKGIEDAIKAEKAKGQAEATRAALRREAGKEKAKAISKSTPKQERATAISKEGKRREVEAIREKAKERGHEPAQSQEGILKTVKGAKKANETVLLEYEAEGGKSGVGGESESANYRFKHDTVLDTSITDNGDITVKVINAEGQLRTRHVHEKMSGSRIVSATRTGEPARYALEDGQVKDLKTGQIVEQVKEGGVFSSQIRADIEKLENFNRTLRKYKQKQARVGDIVKTARDIDDQSLLDGLDDRNPKITEDISGDPC